MRKTKGDQPGKAEEAFLIVRALGRGSFRWRDYRDAWDAVSPSRGYWSPSGSQLLPAPMRQDGFKCTVGNALRALCLYGIVRKTDVGWYQVTSRGMKPDWTRGAKMFVSPGKVRPGYVRYLHEA